NYGCSAGVPTRVFRLDAGGNTRATEPTSEGNIMRTLQRLLLCVICLSPSLAAQSGPVDSTRISRAIQDSTGQVWGIGASMGASLYRWGGDKWNPVEGVSGISGTVALANGPDG